ncbi:MAG TPA: CHAP domain-containing protein [Asticcacaulis sp.]|nr:CHAP domain-containing protein [Asticcacaulis sp.]
MQCVTFARNFTGMQIFGDAWTWWEKATGKYDEGQAPKPGAVLVFKSQGKMKLGHVAVVSQIITDRYIQITHANWSPVNGRRGQVEDHVNVLDVSEKGDWSKVKVWYGPLNDLGTTIYNTYGFIYNSSQPAPAAQTAVVQTAAPSQAPRQQIAAATATVPAMEVPAELKAALTPAATGAVVKPVLTAAKITGPAASVLTAQLDAPADATKTGSDTAKTDAKTGDAKTVKTAAHKAGKTAAKTVKAKASVKRKSKRFKS